MGAGESECAGYTYMIVHIKNTKQTSHTTAYLTCPPSAAPSGPPCPCLACVPTFELFLGNYPSSLASYINIFKIHRYGHTEGYIYTEACTFYLMMGPAALVFAFGLLHQL